MIHDTVRSVGQTPERLPQATYLVGAQLEASVCSFNGEHGGESRGLLHRPLSGGELQRLHRSQFHPEEEGPAAIGQQGFDASRYRSLDF